MRSVNIDILHNPEFNKSTAFSDEERRANGIEGLLPDSVESLNLQLRRVMKQLSHKSRPLDQYIYLMGILDHDETLFYATVMSDPKRFLPIVYDPTIGEVCLKFGHIFRQPRGMYISLKYKGRIKEVLQNWPEKDIKVICVTNGGRILGLGDLGANGMGIPIGKLQLYTAAAGVPPKNLLPMLIDVGTNNDELLNDELYLGVRQKRPSTKELYEFTDEFVDAVQEVFPGCCIHFEDWTGVDAMHLLYRYRDRVSCYNDDIQGTAGITLAGMINACKIKGTKLKDESYLFLGAGSAGIGLANLLCSALVEEGLTLDEARAKVNMFDTKGLLEASRDDLFDFQQPYAHDNPKMGREEFVEAIMKFSPTTIIGVSTTGSAFSQEVVEAMSRVNERPIILALSNPTEKAECTAKEAYTWSNGKAIFAAGVQFEPVLFENETFLPGQANNFYIFPAVGMAIYATGAKRVSDQLFIEAAKAVADQVESEKLQKGCLYPDQADILEAETVTAIRVARLIYSEGNATVPEPEDVDEFIRGHIYRPSY